MSKIIQIKDGKPLIVGSSIHKKIQLQIELENLLSKMDDMSWIIDQIPGDVTSMRNELTALRAAYADCVTAVAKIDAGE